MHVCGMKSGLPTWCKDTLARRHPRLARMAAGPGIIEPPTLERAVAAVTVCVPCELKRVHPVSSRTYATCSHALARQRARLLLQAGCETRHGATTVQGTCGSTHRVDSVVLARRAPRRVPGGERDDHPTISTRTVVTRSEILVCEAHHPLPAVSIFTSPSPSLLRAPANGFFCFTAWLLRVE